MKNYKSEDRHSKPFQKEDAYIRAEKRVKEIKGFYWHAFWYVAVNIFLLVINGSNNIDVWHFGMFSTPVFWGIGLAFHAMSVFGKNLFFSKKWEERKMKEYMDKDKKHWD